MKEQVKDLYNSGYAIEEISDETGISETKVFKELVKNEIDTSASILTTKLRDGGI